MSTTKRKSYNTRSAAYKKQGGRGHKAHATRSDLTKFSSKQRRRIVHKTKMWR